MKLGFSQFFWEQLTVRVPPVVEKDLEGKTVIVTGANVGIGFEAAKHFARMNAGRVIIACRDQQRGDAALLKLKQEIGRNNVELWLLDLANFASVKAFADRFEKEGGRLDILVENAAVIPNLEGKFEPTIDGWEPALQVNGLSTTLLALLLLPRMLETAEKYHTTPRLVVVASEVHYWTSLDSAAVLNDENFLQMFGRSTDYVPGALKTRYQDSKLLNVFFARALNDKLNGQPVIVNSVNPGYCYSSLRRGFTGLRACMDWIMEKVLARTAEEGSRQLIWAAIGETEKAGELRGAYISLARVIEPSDYVISEEGKQVQNRLWDNFVDELVKVDSRVADIVKGYLTQMLSEITRHLRTKSTGELCLGFTLVRIIADIADRDLYILVVERIARKPNRQGIV